MSWIEYDITFCFEDCGNLKCYRNYKKMPEEEQKYPHSFAFFRNTEECEGYKKPKGDK